MTSRWPTRRVALALVAVFAVGVALRGLSLWTSPLPFNPDGFYHAHNAAGAVATGALPLGGMAVDDLGFGAFLAVVGLVVDQPTQRVAQPVVAVVGTVPAVVGALVARRASRRLGYDRSSSGVAGVVAGALLAVGGVYLYRSMPVDEQTLGLAAVPVALTAVAVALGRGDRRWLVLAAPVLVFLPSLHNLDSVVTGLSLFSVAVLAVTRHRSAGRGTFAVVIAVGFTLWYVVYTLGTAQLTAATVIQSERVVTAPGLLVAWLVLGAAVVVSFPRLRTRTQQFVLVAPFCAMFLLVVVNALVPVFPGTSRTTTGVLPALGLAIPALVAAWAGPLVVRDGGNRSVLTALLAGPLVLVGFALTAALTPVYVTTAIRTHWFLYVPVMTLAGVGVVALFDSRLDGRRALRALVVVLVVGAVAVSIPTAFGGLAVHTYKGVTTTGEFAASTFAVERVPGAWASDDHLTRITSYRTTGTTGRVAPVYDWIHGTNGLPPDCPVLVRDSWATVGAQFFPRAPETLPRDRLASFERAAHKVYSGGSVRDISLVVPTGGTEGGC
jgi:hypothetical protein